MKTTDVRKLLPDSWGFLCPVHTPDGSPCGLLNHLAAACRVTDVPPAGSRKAIKTALSGLHSHFLPFNSILTFSFFLFFLFFFFFSIKEWVWSPLNISLLSGKMLVSLLFWTEKLSVCKGKKGKKGKKKKTSDFSPPQATFLKNSLPRWRNN